ncbi:MAG: hypothetical protein AABX96_00970 [Nanoarchaeota archaeon]
MNNKMVINLEMVREFEVAVWESIEGVPYLPARSASSGSTVGTHEVDGYYWVGNEHVRQIRDYDVRTPHNAVDRAKADGLASGIMVETILTEEEPFAPAFTRQSIKYNLPFDN